MRILSCLTKILVGCLAFFILLIVLVFLLFYFSMFSHEYGKLYGITYTLNEDGESYAISDYGAWNIRKSFSIPTTYRGKPITAIENRAFEHSKLISINIPDTVITIAGNSFDSCDNLKSITVDKNNINYQSIDGNIYTKDGKTLIKYAPGKNATQFAISNDVTKIEDWAFSGCKNLTSVSIPDSVTEIGYLAFDSCPGIFGVVIPTSVTKIDEFSFANYYHYQDINFSYSPGVRVFYKGTEEEWNTIEIDGEIVASLYYYSESRPTAEGNYWHYDVEGVVMWK